jgi:hypothetical protein
MGIESEMVANARVSQVYFLTLEEKKQCKDYLAPS